MIHAELNGKDSTKSRMSDMEDVITSNVFGVLGNIDPVVLSSFIQKAGLPGQAQGPFDLQFWPNDFIGIKESWACEPDLIISGQGILLFVEAKLGAEFGKGADYEFEGNQLQREYTALEKYQSETPADGRYLLVVTSDILKPQDKIMAQFDNNIPCNVRWINWQQAWRTLAECLGQVSCQVSLKWMQLLKELLEKKGLDEFVGIGSIKLQEVDLIQWENLV